VQLAQEAEQRGGLQRIVAFELAHDPRPVGRERVRAGAVGAGLAALTRQLLSISSEN
jgi:hypothetical protein